jgi:hypothetical protein
MTRPPDLIYAVDEQPPRAILVVSALQHIALMAITLIFPIIIAREANLSGAQFLDMMSLSMLGLRRCDGMFQHSLAIHRLRLSVPGRIHGDLSRPFFVRVTAWRPCPGFRHDRCQRIRAACRCAIAAAAAGSAAFRDRGSCDCRGGSRPRGIGRALQPRPQ